MADLLEIVGRLPPGAREELLDFAEFLDRKYSISEAWPEQDDWRSMTEASTARVWDNTEDDVYAGLL